MEIVGTCEANKLSVTGDWAVLHTFNRGSDPVFIMGRRAKYPGISKASQELHKRGECGLPSQPPKMEPPYPAPLQ